MYHLPQDIITRIFEFDPTYHCLKKAVVHEFNLLRMKKNRSDTQEDMGRLRRLGDRINPVWVQRRIELLMIRIKQKSRRDRLEYKQDLITFHGFARVGCVRFHKTHKKLLRLLHD